MTPVSALQAQQFPVTRINPEKWPKTAVFNGRDNSSARGTRFTMDDGLYSRQIFPLSNGVYRMSLRLSIAEQSARDPSRGCRLFPGTVLVLCTIIQEKAPFQALAKSSERGYRAGQSCFTHTSL